jgi:hypothetical protein
MPAAALTATAVVGGSLIGAGAAKSAAKTQANAARDAAAQQLQMFETIRGDLAPYRQFGGGALPMLGGLLGYGSFGGTGSMGYPGVPASSGTPATTQSDWSAYLKANPDVLAEYNRLSPTVDMNSPWAAQHGFGNGPEGFAQYHYDTFGKGEGRALPTINIPGTPGTPGSGAGPMSMQAYLESIPGYQFAKSQGMDSVRNLMTSKGLGGVSGAFGKGLARFVTGLADSTYGDQINRLMSAATMGQNAAVQTGSAGLNATSNAGSALLGGAAAQAAGRIGAANNIAGGLYQLGNTPGVTNAIGSGIGRFFGGGTGGSVVEGAGGGGGGLNVPGATNWGMG